MVLCLGARDIRLDSMIPNSRCGDEFRNGRVVRSAGSPVIDPHVVVVEIDDPA
jgi:hypothetical protein